MEFSTCDFCDRFKSDESGRLRVLPVRVPQLRGPGPLRRACSHG